MANKEHAIWGNWHASTSHSKAAAVIAPLMDSSLRWRYFFGSLLTGVCSIQLLLRFLSFPATVKTVPLIDSAYGIPYISVDATFLRIFAGRKLSLMVELLWSNIRAGRKLVSYAIVWKRHPKEDRQYRPELSWKQRNWLTHPLSNNCKPHVHSVMGSWVP